MCCPTRVGDTYTTGNVLVLFSLASDPEIRRLGEGAGGETLARAARSGDAAALRAAAEGLLSTREGRALAERLSALGYGRG